MSSSLEVVWENLLVKCTGFFHSHFDFTPEKNCGFWQKIVPENGRSPFWPFYVWETFYVKWLYHAIPIHITFIWGRYHKRNIEDDFESFLGNALFAFARSHLKLVCIPLEVIKPWISFNDFLLTFDENYMQKIFDQVANRFLDFDCKLNVYWVEISTSVI